MKSLRTRVIAATGLLIAGGLLLLVPSTTIPAADISCEEEIVAGSPDHFMTVRHVVLKGSDYAIGKQLGEIVSLNGDSGPARSGDRRRNRVLRRYMQENYPALFERMKGLADAFGVDLNDDAYDLSALPQFHLFGPGCSAVFYPGSVTEDGHCILSRNFDFTTGTVLGTRAEGSLLPALARPYVLEIYPDDGYASIAICAFDVLGGVLDGMNSEGLTVAIFADDETPGEYGLEPSQGVGLNELLSMRYLLDNCSNVEEAKEAMLYHKHYYSFIPCQYLIADRDGNSFVFEFSPLRHGTSIVDGDGPQCVTNHPVSNYKSVDEFPEDSQLSTYRRYRTLSAATEGKDEFTLEDIILINASAAIAPRASKSETRAPGRTLWHSLYDVETLTLRVKFYLGEKPDPADETRVIFEYTPYLEFGLDG